MKSVAILLVLLWPGFAFAAPSGCEALARQVPGSGPVFVASYPTATVDQLRGVAFLYDNAVATLALIGCRDGKHAAQIGDAMLRALDHDRYWHDGRLRSTPIRRSRGSISTSRISRHWPGWPWPNGGSIHLRIRILCRDYTGSINSMRLPNGSLI